MGPGGLRINIESTQGPLVGPFPEALCLTEDGRVVPETSVDARVMLVAKGGSITKDRAEKHGLMKYLEKDEPKAPAAKKAPAKKAAKKDDEE